MHAGKVDARCSTAAGGGGADCSAAAEKEGFGLGDHGRPLPRRRAASRILLIRARRTHEQRRAQRQPLPVPVGQGPVWFGLAASGESAMPIGGFRSVLRGGVGTTRARLKLGGRYLKPRPHPGLDWWKCSDPATPNSLLASSPISPETPSARQLAMANSIFGGPGTGTALEWRCSTAARPTSSTGCLPVDER